MTIAFIELFALQPTSGPEQIDFTMNGNEVLLMPRAIEELTQ